jgi:hypothetical protein
MGNIRNYSCFFTNRGCEAEAAQLALSLSLITPNKLIVKQSGPTTTPPTDTGISGLQNADTNDVPTHAALHV